MGAVAKKQAGTNGQQAFTEVLRKNSVHPFPAAGAADDTAACAMSIYQLVSRSLVGPFGVHPETFLAALGALTGYAAKWAIAMDVAEGRCASDFTLSPLVEGRNLVLSPQVSGLLAGGAGALTPVVAAAARSGAAELPNMDLLVTRALLPARRNAFPDYSFGLEHWPQIAPEALLRMLWENSCAALRDQFAERANLVSVFAAAAAHAISVYRDNVPAGISVLIVAETAVAMSKVDRAF